MTDPDWKQDQAETKRIKPRPSEASAATIHQARDAESLHMLIYRHVHNAIKDDVSNDVLSGPLWTSTKSAAEEIAALASVEQRGEVAPSGAAGDYVLVPCEPTPQMCFKGVDAWFKAKEHATTYIDHAVDCYKAMLAAAPPAPAGGVTGWSDTCVHGLPAHSCTSCEPLHPATAALVREFADALAVKLLRSQQKYGYTDGWLTEPDWEDACRKHLITHVAKGDPLDVAAYCAFMWRRGWSTSAVPASDGGVREALRKANDWLLRPENMDLVGSDDIRIAIHDALILPPPGQSEAARAGLTDQEKADRAAALAQAREMEARDRALSRPAEERSDG